jgi:hypothetical protein
MNSRAPPSAGHLWNYIPSGAKEGFRERIKTEIFSWQNDVEMRLTLRD